MRTAAHTDRPGLRRVRGLVLRGLTVLGGTAAGTAVAWAIASGSASADALFENDLLSDRPVVPTATEFVEGITGVNGAVPGELSREATTGQVDKALDVVRVDTPQPLRLELVDPAEQDLDELIGHPSSGAPVSTEAAPALPVALASLFAWDNEVVNLAPQSVRSPDRTVTPGSRTTSGVEYSQDGTDGAPAQSPASVSVVPAASTAIASAAGSSLLLLAMDHLTNAGENAGLANGLDHRTASGKPNTIGVQPGIAPD